MVVPSAVLVTQKLATFLLPKTVTVMNTGIL